MYQSHIRNISYEWINACQKRVFLFLLKNIYIPSGSHVCGRWFSFFFFIYIFPLFIIIILFFQIFLRLISRFDHPDFTDAWHARDNCLFFFYFLNFKLIPFLFLYIYIELIFKLPFKLFKYKKKVFLNFTIDWCVLGGKKN